MEMKEIIPQVQLWQLQQVAVKAAPSTHKAKRIFPNPNPN